MSNETDRRAIGARNEAERRGIGTRMVNDRKAIRAGIEAARASTFKDDLNTLETAPRRQVSIGSREAKGSRPATVGTGTYKAPAATSTGGGIASPLTEPSFAAREWWPAGIPSTDGLLMLPAEKKVVLADADGAPVVINYAVPTP